ncbi:CVNH domain-containing protein [Mycena venus]|uniref:CVNH domain-containing protein n=1 Tax=Mycena venus TaxID=2733690 RepID=A0A8H6YWH5_9AGAR|nr:CVNH domain-containing protein [Mycena venus]
MSGSRTARSPLPRDGRIAQPRPTRVGDGLFSPDLRGDPGALLNESTFQQNRRQETSESYHTARTGRTEGHTRISESYEEVRTIRHAPTLLDCELVLLRSELTISPKPSSVQFESTTVDLNQHIGNADGELVWGGVGFSDSCRDIHLEETILVAVFSRRGGSEEDQSRLDLDNHFNYSTRFRRFVPVPPATALAEFSAKYMHFAIITQPDMRSFFKSSPFQDAISTVARRAIEGAMSDMQSQMQDKMTNAVTTMQAEMARAVIAMQEEMNRAVTAVQEEMERAVTDAVNKVTTESEEYVQEELRSLTKGAVNHTAYDVSKLAIMAPNQKHAFNQFAPYIGAVVSG